MRFGKLHKLKRWTLALLAVFAVCGEPETQAEVRSINIDIIHSTPPDELADATNTFVNSLASNDEVMIKRRDGSLIHHFFLGRELDAHAPGEMGRVFYLKPNKGQEGHPRVIKFQRGGSRARNFMIDEENSLRLLGAWGIPHVRVHAESDTKVFLVKDFIYGFTAKEMLSHWPHFTPELQKNYLIKLALLFDKLEALPYRVGDLKLSNIIYDNVANKFRVLDPSQLIHAVSQKAKLHNIYSELERRNPEVYRRLKEIEADLPRHLCSKLGQTGP